MASAVRVQPQLTSIAFSSKDSCTEGLVRETPKELDFSAVATANERKAFKTFLHSFIHSFTPSFTLFPLPLMEYAFWETQSFSDDITGH